MEGWIKLYRKIVENPIWTSEKFTRGQAWVDLIILASHKDTYFFKRGVKVKVKRGQIGISEIGLGDRWKWSRNKVRKFLNELEKEQQIKQQKNNVTQLITILNYNQYQEKEQQKIQQTGQQTEQQKIQQIVQQKDCKKTAKRLQKDIIKNDKNVKNVKNNKIYSPEIINVFDSIKNLFDEKYISENWKEEIRKLIEIDGQEPLEIIQVVEWARKDDFWSQNFLSINKLRQKDKQKVMYYDVFLARMNKNKSKTINDYDTREIFENRELYR